MSIDCTHFVGLDYHLNSIQVCILDGQGEIVVNQSVANCPESVDRLVRKHAKAFRATIETCTGAVAMADTLKHRFGWKIAQAHAGYVARMKQSPDKSDFTDARVLADLVRVGYVPEVWLPPEAIQHLRTWVRRREQLVKDRTRDKQRVRAVLRQYRITLDAPAWSRAWLAELRDGGDLPEAIREIIVDLLTDIRRYDEKVKAVTEKLVRMTADDPLVQKLLRIKGVGSVTAIVMRAEIGDFTRFRTGKQLAHFCGLSPRNVSSGKRQATSGLILAGSKSLRRVIIEAAHRLARYDRRWCKMLFQLHARKHKPKCVAIAAIANRWIRGLLYQIQELYVSPEARPNLAA